MSTLSDGYDGYEQDKTEWVPERSSIERSGVPSATEIRWSFYMYVSPKWYGSKKKRGYQISSHTW